MEKHAVIILLTNYLKNMYIFTKLGDLCIRETHCYSCYLKFEIAYLIELFNQAYIVKGPQQELKHTPWFLGYFDVASNILDDLP